MLAWREITDCSIYRFELAMHDGCLPLESGLTCWRLLLSTADLISFERCLRVTIITIIPFTDSQSAVAIP